MLRLWIWGFGLRGLILGFRNGAFGLGFDLGFRIWGLGLQVSGLAWEMSLGAKGWCLGAVGLTLATWHASSCKILGLRFHGCRCLGFRF